jgi:hypothetical protein
LTTEPHHHPKSRVKKIYHESNTTESLIIYEKPLTKWTLIETKNLSSDEKPIRWKKQTNMSLPKTNSCTIKVLSDSKED